jgi:hypothetical protein
MAACGDDRADHLPLRAPIPPRAFLHPLASAFVSNETPCTCIMVIYSKVQSPGCRIAILQYLYGR